MRKYFATGLVILLPIALTFWIVSFIIGILTDPFLGLAEFMLTSVGIHSHEALAYGGKLLALLFLLALIVGIGAVGRYFFFKYLIIISDAILHRIPFISAVYKTSQEFIQTLFNKSNQSFKQVVLVPFPHADVWSIGLITRDDFEIDGRVAVFVPTTPNPTSGFLLMYRRDQLQLLDMKADEALRYILSCGVLLSTDQKNSVSPFKLK
jgi:uncharacterized membrane protein